MKKAASIAVSLVLAFQVPDGVWGGEISVGPFGIDAIGLGLTGSGVTVGMVEPARAGDPSFDGNATSHNDDVDPNDTFFRICQLAVRFSLLQRMQLFN